MALEYLMCILNSKERNSSIRFDFTKIAKFHSFICSSCFILVRGRWIWSLSQGTRQEYPLERTPFWTGHPRKNNTRYPTKFRVEPWNCEDVMLPTSHHVTLLLCRWMTIKRKNLNKWTDKHNKCTYFQTGVLHDKTNILIGSNMLKKKNKSSQLTLILDQQEKIYMTFKEVKMEWKQL